MPAAIDMSPERVELVLHELESLPTPPPVALRLLRLTSSDEADIHEITELVQADAALTTKLLSLCRKAHTGLGETVLTVERAIVMLGFDQVRAALLSVHLHEFLSSGLGAGGASREEAIDRQGLWRFALAVACGAEMLAAGSRHTLKIKPEEAFVAGVLHGVGKHALDAVLPRAYASVVRGAERGMLTLAEAERRLIGIDHHTVGKRVAEQWGLPHALQDVMWLYGQSASAAPESSHKALIGVVTVAHALARRLHIGWCGDANSIPDATRLADDWGLDPEQVEHVERSLFDRVAERIEALGVDQDEDPALAFESILAANRRLAQLNEALQRRTRAFSAHADLLLEVERFLESVTPSRGMVGTASEVARSAIRALTGEPERDLCAIVYQRRGGAPWEIFECRGDAKVQRRAEIEPPAGFEDLASAIAPGPSAQAPLPVSAWVVEHVECARAQSMAQVTPLTMGSARPALLVHAAPGSTERWITPGAHALRAAWISAINAAAQHEGARRLSEQLAEANRTLTETQEQLTEARSLARLGEFAAGAAHEMNNPLTVIRGRAQLLAQRLPGGPHHDAAVAMAEAGEKLSGLITSLHLFASPPAPKRAMTNVPDLLGRLVRDLRLTREALGLSTPPIRLVIHGPFPSAWIDGEQLGAATEELLRNACDAQPRGFIELRAQIEEQDDRLVILVKDDGVGMSRHALEHAFDPFFSERSAGRGCGLGLARAKRYVELHHGALELESEPDEGTTARIVLEDWRRPADEPYLARRA